MDIEILKQTGLSELQAKIYLFLIENGQQTPTEIANGIHENRTTVYSAAEKLETLGLISKKDRGKIAAYTPNHPSALETLAEKRLRLASRQARNLENTLPSLVNYYNEHQYEPGINTFYGEEGVDYIREKILETKQTDYFVRSRYDEKENSDRLKEFKKQRIDANILAENITPSEFTDSTDKQAKKWLLNRTFLPPDEYDSPVEINIFGDNVAFIDYSKDGMSTLIESPAIADAMRQFFIFSKKYIKKATNQHELLDEVENKADEG